MSDDPPSILPQNPHPIALAFFANHDETIRRSTPERNETISKVVKIRNSLGWRTRFASATWYPVSILPAAASKERDTPIEFHVRQVFPGERMSIRKEDLQQDENDKVVDPIYGTGNTVWPGSIVLLKYIEKLAHNNINGNPFLGKTVADLGSGTSITTIAAAFLGSDFVLCSDGCDHVVSLAASNVKDAVSELDGKSLDICEPCDESDYGRIERHLFNVNGCKVVVRKYLWGDGSLSKELKENGIKSNHFDIILCADCIIPKLYPIEPLVDAIDELSDDATTAYLSYERRHYSEYDPAEEFLRLAMMRDLCVEVVSEEELNVLYPAPDIEIWKVRRKKSSS
jgi:predicted nicotinamide N-methyase